MLFSRMPGNDGFLASKSGHIDEKEEKMGDE